MKKVIHFIRKRSQLKASFIQNQIINHIEYQPCVIFRQKQKGVSNDGGFAVDILHNVKIFDVAINESFKEELLFKYLKQLSKKQIKIIRNKITENQPDVLHFHYGTDAGIYLKSLKNIDIPKVVSFYGYECSGFPRRFWGYGKNYLQGRVFKYADKIFAMSEDMKKDLMALGCPEGKIIVHYYGSDVKHFKMYHDYSQNKTTKFLIISGLEPQKGHAFLLNAFAKAFEQNKNISLTIVGAGKLKNKIIQQVMQLKLQDAVTLPGSVVYGSAEHLNYFATHDVFIHPSVTDTNGDKEGIPGAIVEAMAAGLPVISTYHAGIPHVIHSEKTGLLVHEHDINALTDAILRMSNLSDLRKKLGVAAQQLALDFLDLKKKEIELEQHYSDAISKMLHG